MAGACAQLAAMQHAPTYSCNLPGKDIVLALAANKSDLERSRQVKQEDAEAYAASIGAVLFGTSAKLNKGVEQVFLAIATSACST